MLCLWYLALWGGGGSFSKLWQAKRQEWCYTDNAASCFIFFEGPAYTLCTAANKSLYKMFFFSHSLPQPQERACSLLQACLPCTGRRTLSLVKTMCPQKELARAYVSTSTPGWLSSSALLSSIAALRSEKWRPNSCCLKCCQAPSQWGALVSVQCLDLSFCPCHAVGLLT